MIEQNDVVMAELTGTVRRAGQQHCTDE